MTGYGALLACWLGTVGGSAAAPPAAPPDAVLREKVRAEVLAKLGPKPAGFDEAAFASLWLGERPLLDAVVLSIAQFRPQVRRLLAATVHAPPGELPAPMLPAGLDDPFLRANLALYLARELLRREWIDESLAQLKDAPANVVVDPATYYFCLASCHFALHQPAPAQAAIDKLLQTPGTPQRYRAIAEQMRGELAALQREALSGIAHDMRDLRRRLARGRADAEVQKREADVVARLDALIRQMEAKQGKGSAGGAANQADRPADDSLPLGGKGEGKVARRTFSRTDPWGNLPEKERERALQELGRQFPARYRDAVEQYFRKLADEAAPP